MANPKINVKVTPEIAIAVREKALAMGVTDAEYVRRLIAADIGVQPPMLPKGVPGMDKQTRKKVRCAAGKSLSRRWREKGVAEVDRDAVIRQIKNGDTYQSIANRHNTTTATVARIAVAAGLRRREPRR